MISKTFQLDSNYSLKIKKFDEGKEIWIVDNIMKVEKFIGFLTNNHKWKELAPDFFSIAKKYPSVFINNIFKPIESEHEVSLDKKFTCFKRRFNVKVIRTLIKLKHTF